MASLSKKSVFFLLVLLISCLKSWAQNQVQVLVNVNPPYSAYLQDYASAGQRVQIQLINLTGQPLPVRLEGSVTGDNGVSIRTLPNYRPPRPLTLPPGATLLSRPDLEGLFNVNQIDVQGMDRNALNRGLPLPDGVYQLCVRVFNDRTGQALSSEFPLGCSAPFQVRAVEPPILIAPMAEAEVTATTPQSVVFTWTPPAGVSPAQVDYTLRIIELPQVNVDPNVFIDQVVLPKTGLEVNNLKVSTFLYGPVHPPLTLGKRYAWRVQAIDRSRRLNFLNDGKSPVSVFTYGSVPNELLKPGFELAQKPINQIPGVNTLPELNTTPPTGATAIANQYTPPAQQVAKNDAPAPPPINCNNGTAPSDKKAVSGSIDGKTLTIGEFQLTVYKATLQGSSFSGEGRVKWNGVPVKVTFNNLKVNAGNQVFEGIVGSTKDGPGMPNISLGQIDAYSGLPNNYFDQIKNNVVESAKQQASVPLPLKYDAKLGTVGINQMLFSPTGAQMDMVLGVSLPEANVNVFLAATNVCMSPAKLLPNTATLYLLKNMPVPIPGSMGQKFEFKKSDYPNLNGTYAKVVNGDFEKVHGVLDLNLGSSVLKLDNGKGNVKGGDVVATLTADFEKWADWIGTVKLPAFQLPLLKGVTFTGTDVVYDHSDFVNPAGFNLPKEYKGEKGPTYQGIYFNKVTVELPTSFKNDPRIGVAVAGGIVDGSGFTGLIKAANKPILDYTNGTLAGFGFSVEDVNWLIVQNNNQGGSMNGKLQFPISNGAFVYNCNLSGGFDSLQFTTKPENGFEVPLFAANMELNPNTAITIDYKAGQKTKIEMTLFGQVSVDVKKFAGSGAVGQALDATIPKLYFGDFIVANTPVKGTSELGGSGLYMSTGNWSLTNDVAKANQPTPDKKQGGGPWSPDESVPEWALLEDEKPMGSLAGFPISLDPPKVINNEKGAGIQLGIGVHLGEASEDKSFVQAHGSLEIMGTVLTENGRFKPTYVGTYPKDISLEGKIGPLEVAGKLDFFYNNTEYGNGMKGNASVTIPNFGAGINMVMLFGSKGYRYGFIDGSVLFTPGISMVGPLMLTGFGGGMRYNMSMDTQKMAVSQVKNEEAAKLSPDLNNPGATRSGVVYKPSKGAWGLSAKVFVGLADTHVFNSNLNLNVDFINGSLGSINLNGKGAVISSTGDPDAKDGIVNSQLDITYGSGKFDAHASVKGEFLASSSVNIPFNMHIDGSKWYVKLGDPHGERVSATLLNISKDIFSVNLGMNGYVAAGNDLGGIPPIPKEVEEYINGKPDTEASAKTALASRGSNYPKVAPLASAKGVPTGNSFKLLLGGQLNGSFKVQVQPFRLWANAVVGFDAGLSKDLTCAEGNTPAGLKGWYGEGQVYTKLDGGVDIYVDVWFFEGSLNLMTLAAGAVLKGGFPNPSWAEGKVKVSGEVLDGLISVETSQSFNFGEKCQPVFNGDPLKEVQIISDIRPADGEKDIDTRPAIAVAFNMPMDKPFSVHIPGGEIRRYRFKAQKTTFTYSTAQKKNVPVTALAEPKWSPDKQSFSLLTTEYLPSNAVCKFGINVVIKEIINYTQEVDPYIDALKKREPRNQDSTVTFMLGKQPEEIPAKDLQMTWPIAQQHYFFKGQYSQGFIRGKYTGLEVLKDINNPAFEYVALFKPGNPNAKVLTEPIQYDGKGLITFKIPAGLENSKLYRLEIRKRKKTNTNSSPLTQTVYASSGNNSGIKYAQTTLNSNAYKALGNFGADNTGQELFAISFAVSRFNTLAEKVQSMGLRASDYGTNYKIILKPTVGVTNIEPFDDFELAGGSIYPNATVRPVLTFETPVYQTPFEKKMQRMYNDMVLLGNDGTDEGAKTSAGIGDKSKGPTLRQENAEYASMRKSPMGFFGLLSLHTEPYNRAILSSGTKEMIQFTYLRDHIMLTDLEAMVNLMGELQRANTAQIRQAQKYDPKGKNMSESEYLKQNLHSLNPETAYDAYNPPHFYVNSPTMRLMGSFYGERYQKKQLWKITEDAFYNSSNYDYGDVPTRGAGDPFKVRFVYEFVANGQGEKLLPTAKYTQSFQVGDIHKTGQPSIDIPDDVMQATEKIKSLNSSLNSGLPGNGGKPKSK